MKVNQAVAAAAIQAASEAANAAACAPDDEVDGANEAAPNAGEELDSIDDGDSVDSDSDQDDEGEHDGSAENKEKLSEEEKLRALRAAASLLHPGGRLVFDVFAPSREDIEETDGLWLEREPGIFERADWDLRTRTLALSVRGGEEATTFELHWLSAPEWHHLIEQAGLVVEELFGWFDRRPYEGGEDQIWVCSRP